METLLLSQMRGHASIVAHKARADWFQYQYAITCLEPTPVEQETPPRSPERSPEHSPDHSLDREQQNKHPTITSPLFWSPTGSRRKHRCPRPKQQRGGLAIREAKDCYQPRFSHNQSKIGKISNSNIGCRKQPLTLGTITSVTWPPGMDPSQQTRLPLRVSQLNCLTWHRSTRKQLNGH